MFNPSVGIVATRCALGIEWNHLLNGDQAMALVVDAAVWKQISYNFLFFLAGLQSIPKSLIEAAAIDGAGPWRRFWTIVFPLLSPTTFFLLVINIVYAFFETFAIIDAATQGGPGKATEILVYKVYYDGFKALDLGGSAAQSVVLMVIVIALTVIQFRYVEKKVHVLSRRRDMVERARPRPSSAPRPDPRRARRRLPGLRDLRRLDADRAGDRAARPMSLLPGDNMLENYRIALFGGKTTAAPRSRRSADDVGQPGQRAGHRDRQDRDLAAVGLRDRLLPLSRPDGVFWMIFVTLMLPVEVRILPTYKVVSDLGMLNTYAGLTIPLIASATATFLFRQFFLTVPDELVEAARIDGAGPMRFFKDVLLPLSRPSIAALFVIQFIYGWNQYLWPLLVTTDEDDVPGRHGHQAHVRRRRRRQRVERGHGHRDPGDDAAGAGGAADAEVVRQGPGRHREVMRMTAMAAHLDRCATSSRTTARGKRNQVIHGVNAEIADGEFVVIVGPSGCGKSTLLRMVAGPRGDHGGEIAIGGRVVNDLEPAERDIAMVFQNYALYPHMSVFDNMAYGLKIAQGAAAEIKQRVDKAAGILELGPCWSASRASSPAASASAWRWAARSCASRRCSCSTSRCPTSTPSCARRRGSRSRSCTASWASPRCSSPTTRSRR